MCTRFCLGSSGGCEEDFREAAHAGSWYPDDPQLLRAELLGLLSRTPRTGIPGHAPKALIAPHAGLRYCGQTASYAYANLLATSSVSRIVVLGPSHHKRLEGCALPAIGVGAYRTPLGPIRLDGEGLAALRESGEFEELSLGEDEAEHSIEMQLPFLLLSMEQADWTLLPVVVGHLSQQACALFARHLEPFFDDPNTLFVISSDFCHWGARFRYQPLVDARPTPNFGVPGMGLAGCANPVNAGIEALDLRGIDLICRQDGKGFLQYLEAEGNTICGQNPIRLLLKVLANRQGHFSVRFLHYSQSRLLGTMPGPNDSSVSYAAAICEAVPAPIR